MAPAVAEARATPSPGDGGSAFARALASGGQKQRDAALAALSRWLASRSEVDETEILKLWKGLFYAMWHADKPVVQARRSRAPSQPRLACRPTRAHRDALLQADVAERMASVLDSSKPEVRGRWAQPHLCRLVYGVCCSSRPRSQVALACFRGCFTTLRCARLQRCGVRSAARHPSRHKLTVEPAPLCSRDWFVIDRLRLDKFMVLVRKVLHHLFACLQRHRWCVCAPRAASAAAAAHSVFCAPHAQGSRHVGLRRSISRGEGAHGASPPAMLAAVALLSLPRPSVQPPLVLTHHAGHGARMRAGALLARHRRLFAGARCRCPASQRTGRSSASVCYATGACWCVLLPPRLQ